MIKTENSPSWFTFSVKPRTVHFVLLFCKERLIFRIVSRCITHMQSQCTVHPFVQRRLRCRCLKEPVRQQYCALRARALLEIEVCIHRDVIMMSLYFQRICAQNPESHLLNSNKLASLPHYYFMYFMFIQALARCCFSIINKNFVFLLYSVFRLELFLVVDQKGMNFFCFTLSTKSKSFLNNFLV